MRAQINIDTLSKINSFVAICARFDCKVKLIDGEGYCVNGKSLIGCVATMDWSKVYVECDRDIYAYISEFVVND